MWIPWSDEEAAKVETALRTAGMTAEADKIKGELAFRQSPQQEVLKQALAERYTQFSDGDIDIDDKVAISESDDGAYVLAWLWLTNEEMGVDSDED